MRRAIELARLGAGSVAPNPMVGCVIVKNDTIIGEGWHRKYGGPHAEPNALAEVTDPELLNGADLYVTLEPCSHFGKTPPCADALAKIKFNTIYVACLDPNPLVAGKGIEKLISAGLNVEIGMLEEECVWLNRRFFTFQEKKRPFVVLKWAETADGFIARENFDSKWISNELSRTLVHRWRAEEDAVMVGTNTALYDNPRLNVRDWTGRNPVRVFLDKHLQVPAGAHLLDGSQNTVCYNYQKQAVINLVEYVKLDPAFDLLEQVFNDLYERKISSVLVEGGSVLLKSLIDKKLWDEARVFRSPVMFETGIDAPRIRGKIISKDVLEEDELVVYQNPGVNNKDNMN